MRISRVFSAIVIAMACAQAAQAAGVAFMNKTIVAKIPKKDWPQFSQAVGDALNNSPDGTTTNWTSQTHLRGGPVSVALTPSDTMTGGQCRLMSADVAQQTAKEHWQFMFCKDADGHWRASTS